MATKTRATKEHLPEVTMPALTPSSLDSATLADRLAELTGKERNVQVDFLLHLDEYDRRRAYLEAGYGSLWAYCLEALHLREGPAGRRIQAMRVLRRFPSLEPDLRDGRLCISTIPLLGQVLTPENLENLVTRAAFKTKAEVDHLVASIQPRPAPKDGIRKLPERRTEAPEGASLPLAATPECSSALATPVTASHASSPPGAPSLILETVALSSAAPSVSSHSRRSEIRPASKTEWSLRVTVDDAFKADLETLRDLLSHKFPDGDLASVLHEAIRCAIDKHGKRQGTVAPSRKTSPRGVAPARASGESPLAAEPPPAPRAQRPRCAGRSPRATAQAAPGSEKTGGAAGARGSSSSITSASRRSAGRRPSTR
jgi:hypothetical protein